MDYGNYGPDILIENHEGVAIVTYNRPDKLNAMTPEMHSNTGKIWIDFANDPAVRSVLITGAGRAFSVGGDYDLLNSSVGNYEGAARLLEETRSIAYNMTNLDKPIVSAINGYALGGGLAVAIMADISIAGENAMLLDGHGKLGDPAGDHAAMCWPLLMGMAKAKRYLLTGDSLTGAEAERAGLISMAVPDDELLTTAMSFATRLAKGPPRSIGMTKRSLNQWLRLAGHTAFDYSAALETLGFLGTEVKEGLASLQEKRDPKF